MLNAAYYKYLLRRSKLHGVSGENQELDTSFENSTGEEMLTVIENLFDIKKVHNFGAFSEEVSRSLNLPRLLRSLVILSLTWFDYFWVKMRLLNGKILMGYARKRSLPRQGK